MGSGRVFVAGHTGLAGSAICRRLLAEGTELLTVTRSQLDLRDSAATLAWLRARQPQVVVVAAARVGGIVANQNQPADFIADNLSIQQSLIMGAFAAGVKQLLFLGSSCIYPRLAPQPISEEALLTGPLEPTNEAYAIAKIAGIKLCEALDRQHGMDYRALMPTNLYGPGDNFHPEHSHVLAALLRRFSEAQASAAPSVSLWGSGTPRREFLHVDDLADACAFVLKLPRARWESATAPDRRFVNVGCGADLSISELAALIADCVGYQGAITHDRSRPDGTPRKLLDVSRLRQLGWSARIDLRAGIEQTLRWLRAHPPQ
jgi:nucleoside-diphosphate-sugar epimerase